MRLGVISDVHGNRHALEATLDRLTVLGIDRLVCAGDIVGWGPEPNACVELLAERDVVAVAGNHDLIVLDRLTDERCSSLARDTQRWTRTVLRDDARAWLAQLPEQARVGPIMVAHGSLEDPQEYVRSEARAAEQLEELRRREPDAQLLVLGHTHQPWVVTQGMGTRSRTTPSRVRLDDRRSLLNPGSVGQSRSWELTPHARFAVIDLHADVVQLEEVAYDWRAARDRVRAVGLPHEAIHARPKSPARLLRRAAGVAQGLARVGARATTDGVAVADHRPEVH